MCDQRCPQCRKCDEPEVCESCNLTNEMGMIQAICGHLICPGCVILCESCDEAICPACVVKRDGGNYCGEVDCMPEREKDGEKGACK